MGEIKPYSTPTQDAATHDPMSNARGQGSAARGVSASSGVEAVVCPSVSAMVRVALARCAALWHTEAAVLSETAGSWQVPPLFWLRSGLEIYVLRTTNNKREFTYTARTAATKQRIIRTAREAL